VLRYIVRKEVLQRFLSLRFSCMLILVAAVMISNAFLFIEDYRQQLEDYDQNVLRNSQMVSRLSGAWHSIYLIFNFRHQWVYRTPTKLAFLAEGNEKALPNAFEVNSFTIEGPTRKLRGNHLVPDFEDLDWAFVISVIMSFAAIILTYDSISGERENGTLRLSMSNSVPRSTVILGKYLGTMAVLILPFLIGALAAVIIISASDSISLLNGDWLKIAAAAFLSLSYLSIFIMLGLFVSSMLRSSAACLVVLLLAWVAIVVVIPEIGGGVVPSAWKIPNPARMYTEAKAARDQAWYDYNARHPNASKVSPSGWGYGRELARAVEAEDARMHVYNRYWNQMVSQVRLGYNLSRISPTGVYRRAVEAMAGSGIDHYENFLRQVRQYKLTLRSFVLDHYPLNVHGFYGMARTGREALKKLPEFVEALSRRIFTAAEIPKFRDDPIPIEDSITSSLWNVAILFAFNVVFFMAAYISFLNRDVR
jgi:ABC-type transport system involved in multi-copper enzyme maturation permease subunit